MFKTETEEERRFLAKKALSDLQLEGLAPDAFGEKLIERFIKGELTPEEAIELLNQHYKGKSSVKVA